MDVNAPDILKRIVERRRQDVEEAKRLMVADRMEEYALEVAARSKRDFASAIKSDGPIRLIAEIKRRSPSKGVIRDNFDLSEIARAYDSSRAAAISVLTEPNFFDGRNEYLNEVRKISGKPLLRKDFIFHEFQVYESRILGADAILLIASILADYELRRLLTIAESLAMAALVEVHDEHELKRALKAGAKIIGINNRNLRDFSEDLETTMRLRQLIPGGNIVVSESAVRTRDDVKRVEDHGVDAILVGEMLMRSEDIGRAIEELLG